MADVFAFIIGVLVVCLWANTTRDVYADQIELAQEVCKPHHGVARIQGTVFQNVASPVAVVVKCQTGVTIEASVQRGRQH